MPDVSEDFAATGTDLNSRQTPHPRRRKSLVPRSPELSRSLPAITLLSPDAYHLQQTMTPRPLSPGAFRMLTPRSAKRKISSFVILNETIDTPVASRGQTPSGRVSPFRGHGFKSPASSRSGSRAASPLPSPTRGKGIIVPNEKSKIIYKDIGLPPKSPKRLMKNVKIQEHKQVAKYKPTVPAKPVIKAGATAAKNINKKSMVMSTVGEKNDKKPPAPPENVTQATTQETADKIVGKDVSEKNQVIPEPKNDEPTVVSEAVPVNKESDTEIGEKTAEKKTEKVIPCFQPDKCCIVPPTMASPLQTATSTVTAPASASVTVTTRAPTSSLSAVTAAVSVTDAFSKRSLHDRPITPKSPRTRDQPTVSKAGAESAEKIETEVRSVGNNRVSSAISKKSPSKLSVASPTVSERTRSSMVTVRAASSGSLRDDGEHSAVSSAIMSTTKLIRSGPDVEVLSPNNLLRSPPNSTVIQTHWENGSTRNGTAAAEPKGRCSRFLSALWRIITYVFCCCKQWRCWANCTKRWTCSSTCCQRIKCSQISNCCKKDLIRPSEQTDSCWTRCRRRCCCNPFAFLSSCFSKLNCCKNARCKKPCGSCSGCCTKIKCCEGQKCCKRGQTSTDRSTKTSCCAKPSCSCKDCCAKMKNCCSSCGDCINNCCRSFFCLNLACCQKCLRKCSCCHKYKCCKKGGCCSCCNPHVKREQKAKLDKKNSRASNQSKQERAKLDSALVDHNSMMKAAIPVLPSCLAWFCLLLNLIIPGSGTVISGILCLCFGKPRFSVNDNAQNRMSSCLINVFIGIGQAFTIIFCLVGWGWSIWWGVIMVKLARKQKRLRLVEKNTEGGQSIMNHVDIERR